MQRSKLSYVITIVLLNAPGIGMAQEEPLVVGPSPGEQNMEENEGNSAVAGGAVEVQAPPPVYHAPSPPPVYHARAASHGPTIVRHAPEPPELKRNGIHINPLSIAFGVYGLGYERVLNDYFAVQVQGIFMKPWTSDNVWGLGAGLRPSFFFFRDAPGGMYLSPFASLAYSRATEGLIVGEAAAWSVGGTIGYSWVIGPVNIRAGAGVQYIDIGASAGDGKSGASVSLAMVLPALDLSLGFVF